MVKIRLTRMGTTKRPFYRIVAIDSRKKRDGAYLENLGVYHPLENGEKEVQLNVERIKHWLGNGAKPSHTVKELLNKKGIELR
ncbi:MAG: 30S ribosomal protein S16 [Spirochaetes bacterium DG_61]|nr:MAG: 30S ribosomal protein S16 [Spirochaetes bacterium DG_61]